MKSSYPYLPIFTLALALTLGSPAHGQDDGFEPLFNGKDLTGWAIGYARLAGKAATDDGRFAVKDGVLVVTGAKGTPARMAEIDTAESFDGDFTLRLDFRASENANSGIHLRDKLFAHQLQVRDYPRVGPYKNLKNYKPGDWNALEIAVKGTTASATCNGETLETALAIPREGPLSIQSETNTVEYRNIRVRRANPAYTLKRNIPYASPAHTRQILDVYSPPDAKNLPVVVWIHGGGWQVGDKTSVQAKPEAFTSRKFVFVSINYRLLPDVNMPTIVADVAKAIRWVHEHISDHGGDPKRLLVMGHSAGAQLAALVATDDRYLKAEGVPPEILKGCVPVDGDTFDVPAIIEVAEVRQRTHHLPPIRNGHRVKFGNTPESHRDLSAVTHVARGKPIPPFLILHVAGHPDTSAQAQRLASVLLASGIPARIHSAAESNHHRINANLGLPDDPGTKALFDFTAEALAR